MEQGWSRVLKFEGAHLYWAIFHSKKGGQSTSYPNLAKKGGAWDYPVHWATDPCGIFMNNRE